MGLYFDSWMTELFVVLSVATFALYLWFDRAFKYWKNKGVPYVEPSFPFGNVQKCLLGQKTLSDWAYDLYKQLPGGRYIGFYSFRRPHLLVRDPDLIRHILVKDSSTFVDRGFFIDDEEPLNYNLFLLGGHKWRQLRVKLTPTFTSGKLKGMFKTLQVCGQQMVEALEPPAALGEVVEVRELAARFTTDIIASVAFGIEVDSQRQPDNEFRQWGRKVFEPSVTGYLAVVVSFLNPGIMNLLRFKGGAAAISHYFRRMVRETVNYREEKNVSRKDFLELLIQLKNKGYVDVDKGDAGELNGTADISKLTMDEVAAQAFIFFAAGFETSSSTISFTLFELAHNISLQNKLQEEIDSVLKEEGDITYESIAKMTYLDKVVSETLRKYPPLAFLNRECNKDYQVPGSDLVLEKGSAVLVSTLGLHRDPEYFPDPERFDPERFTEEEKARRHPYVYLPFGEGPRICIGMRLGLLQTKVGLVYILSKYSLRTVGHTPSKLDFHSRSFILLSKSGIHLRLEKRK
ncbi:cytochrome P450 6k1-like [Schistocerca gregaria]|uniref:cytochrome P450 6k1-like n=1 Tax=Schistocerca gregaria TaxID=7010 RepID=UPI00211ECC15|nr:cytochrome P450 6k1-like [Schistocerca gregaria]